MNKTMDKFKELSFRLGGKIKKQNLLNINFEEISTRELLVKNYKGFKINVDEFGYLYQLCIDVESNFIFAVNDVEKILKIELLLNIPDFPYDFYILENQFNPFLDPDFPFFWDLFSSKVKEFKLANDESIFIDGYRICLILNSNRNLIPIVDDIIELIDVCDLSFTKSIPVKVQKKNIPDKLKPLFPLLKKWSISDDDLREQLAEKINKRQKRKLIATVGPFINDINEYLDSFKDHPLTEEAILIGNLAELVSELKLE